MTSMRTNGNLNVCNYFVEADLQKYQFKLNETREPTEFKGSIEFVRNSSCFLKNFL